MSSTEVWEGWAPPGPGWRGEAVWTATPPWGRRAWRDWRCTTRFRWWGDRSPNSTTDWWRWSWRTNNSNRGKWWGGNFFSDQGFIFFRIVRVFSFFFFTIFWKSGLKSYIFIQIYDNFEKSPEILYLKRVKDLKNIKAWWWETSVNLYLLSGVNSGGVGILCCQGSIVDQQVDVIAGLQSEVVTQVLRYETPATTLDFHAQNSIIFP